MSALENTVATLCSAVKASAAQSRSARTNPLAPAQDIATGARLVNTIVSGGGGPLLTGASLIPVSDDEESDGSSSEYTSDDENYDDKPNGPTKTINYRGGDLGVVELSGLVTHMPAQQLSSPSQNNSTEDTDVDTVEVNVEYEDNIVEEVDNAAEDDHATESEDEQEGSSSNDEDEDDADDDAVNEVSSVLAGIDISNMNVKELRSLVSQHKLVSNPTKLRKKQLLNVLSAAME